MSSEVFYVAYFKVAICIRCTTGINVRDGQVNLRHFRAEPHRLKGQALKEIANHLSNLDLVDTGSVDYEQLNSQPIPVISHLPVYDALACEHCEVAPSVNPKTSRMHMSSAHGILAGKKHIGLRHCRVQTLFQARDQWRCFEVMEGPSQGDTNINNVTVVANAGVAQESNTFNVDNIIESTKILLENKKKEQLESLFSFDAHQSQQIPYVTKFGWDTYLKDFKILDIVGSYRIPEISANQARTLGEPNQNMAWVIKAATELLLEAQELTLASGPQGRMSAGMRAVLVQFSEYGEKAALGGFRAVQPTTFRNYMRTWNKFLSYYWRVSTGLALAKEETNISQDSDEDSETDELLRSILPAENSFCRGTLEQQEILRSCLSLGEDCVTQSLGQDLQRSTFQRLKKRVASLCISLLKQPIENCSQSPLCSFTAVLAVKADKNGWLPASDINHHFSGLIYCAQILIFQEACRKKDEAYASGDDTDLGTFLRRETAYMKREQDTALGNIVIRRGDLFGFSRADITSHTISWDFLGKIISYQGTKISMEEITRLYHTTLRRAEKILHEDLLLNINTITLIEAIHITDNDHINVVDWWFKQEPQNTAVLAGSEELLVREIYKRPELRAVFYQNGTVEDFQTVAVEMYEEHVQEFLNCLIVMLHLFPAKRSTEIASLKWKNTDQKRSIFVKFNKVMVYTTYHKSLAITGHHKHNIQFLPTRVGSILLTFLTYVQPLREWFMFKLQNETLSPHLWTKNNEVWPDGALSRSLKHACTLAEVPVLSVSHWRQLVVGIVKKHFSRNEEFNVLVAGTVEESGEMQEVEEHLALMSNHSRNTHNFAYANETGLGSSGIYDDLLVKSYAACKLWSDFFKFEDESSFTHGNSKKRAGSELGSFAKRRQALMPPKKRNWSSSDIWNAASKMYDNSSFVWRVDEQERAISYVLSEHPELLIVLGTGSGKSLVFQLPCTLENARTTVLLVPLVALSLDLLKRSRQFGFTCEQWANNQDSRANLVLMSYEAAVSDTGMQYLHTLHFEAQLERIVVDECHVLFTARDYRDVMNKVRNVRQIPVQFVYMTATLPAGLEKELCANQGLLRPFIVRGSTRRDNIQYHVHELPLNDGDLIDKAAKFVKDLWAKDPQRTDQLQRVLVFVKEKNLAEELSELLGCSFFHSQVGSVEKKAAILKDWMSSSSLSPFLVGTSGLGAGLDYGHIRLVVHIDQPSSMIDFIQESGRSGRDGMSAKSCVLLPTGWTLRKKDDDLDGLTLNRFLKSETCRRFPIDEYMDGDETGIKCQNQLGSCDLCHEAAMLNDLADSDAEEDVAELDLVPATPLSQMTRNFTGPQEILAVDKDITILMHEYAMRLTAMAGRCIMCRIAGHSDWREHNLDRRTNCEGLAGQYFEAKKKLSPTYLPNWILCFKCVQPQAICTTFKGSTVCKFKDIVEPAVIAGFSSVKYRPKLENKFGRIFSPGTSLVELLDWSATKHYLSNYEGINGHLVAAYMLEMLEKDRC